MMSWNPKHVKNGVMLFIVVFYIVERHTCIFHWNVFLQSNIFLNKQIRLKITNPTFLLLKNVLIIYRKIYLQQANYLQHLYIIYALGQTISSTISCRIHCNLEQFDDWVRERESERERMDGNELFAFVSE